MPDLENPGAWPDDAVTVTWGELRQLIALHLDRLGDTLGRVAPWEDAHRAARAMRDGETPLLIRDVLAGPEPERPLPGLYDGPAQDRAHQTVEDLLRPPGMPDTGPAQGSGESVNIGGRRSRTAHPDHDHTLELVVPAAGVVRCTGDRIDWEAEA